VPNCTENGLSLSGFASQDFRIFSKRDFDFPKVWQGDLKFDPPAEKVANFGSEGEVKLSAALVLTWEICA
jgi:hypothetical protein